MEAYQRGKCDLGSPAHPRVCLLLLGRAAIFTRFRGSAKLQLSVNRRDMDGPHRPRENEKVVPCLLRPCPNIDGGTVPETVTFAATCNLSYSSFISCIPDEQPALSCQVQSGQYVSSLAPFEWLSRLEIMSPVYLLRINHLLPWIICACATAREWRCLHAACATQCWLHCHRV